MPGSKIHREFFRIALETADGWQPVAGSDGAIEELVLADNLDHVAARGSRTRLARWRAGARIGAPVVHDFHEEVFIVSGDLVVGCDAQGQGGERFDAPTFACRPPGAVHGPFTSVGGCVLLEFQYFE